MVKNYEAMDGLLIETGVPDELKAPRDSHCKTQRQNSEMRLLSKPICPLLLRDHLNVSCEIPTFSII